jgi:hypothetical protein
LPIDGVTLIQGGGEVLDPASTTTRKLRDACEVEAGIIEIACEGGESDPILAEKLRLDGEAWSNGVDATTLIWNVFAGA